MWIKSDLNKPWRNQGSLQPHGTGLRGHGEGGGGRGGQHRRDGGQA